MFSTPRSSSRASAGRVLGVILALAPGTAGCLRTVTFECEEEIDCFGLPEARCEESGYCSFGDSSCLDGRRYSELAGAGFAGQCVGGQTDDAAVSDDAFFDAAIADAAVIDAGGCSPAPPIRVEGLGVSGSLSAPAISGDRLQLFFEHAEGGAPDIWHATRDDSDAAYGPATRVEEIDTDASDGSPSISADGLTLYFASDRPGSIGENDLWVATRGEPTGTFSPAERLETVSSLQDDRDPSISPDGLSLYFTSTRPPSREQDIWVATREHLDDLFSTPVQVGAVNTKWVDAEPSISGDGLTLYLANTHPGSNPDLLAATRSTTDDPFSETTRLPAPLNSSANDTAPAISFDGVELYFASTRESGQLLWVAPLVCPEAADR